MRGTGKKGYNIKRRIENMKERYENFDGIRTFAALGILCMHVLILGQFPKNTAGGDSI